MGRFSKLDLTEPTAPPLAVDPWPNLDGEECLRQGNRQFDHGLYEAALVSYSRALGFDREMQMAWTGQIRCLIAQGEYPEAATWSTRALERFKDAPDLLACKGLALVLDARTREGMEFLDGAIQSRSPSAWVWTARGEGLLALHPPGPNGHACLLKAQEMADGAERASVLLGIGLVYNRRAMFERARTPLLLATRTVQDNPHLFYQLGLALEGLGSRAEAAGYFRQALVLRPDYRVAEQGVVRTESRGFRRMWDRVVGGK